MSERSGTEITQAVQNPALKRLSFTLLYRFLLYVCSHYSYMWISTAISWFICIFSCFRCFFFQAKRPLKSEVGAGSGPSPHSTFTLKPEPQEVVLRSILSGQTNYSPFEKCTFLSSPTFPSSPALPPRLLLHMNCFRSSREEQWRRRSALLPALSQHELRSDSSRAAAAAVAQAPKFLELFSCGVPWRLVVFLPKVSPQRFCGIS